MPLLRAWLGRHSVAAIIEDAADQQGLGFGARCFVMTVRCSFELGLDGLEQIAIDDGRLLARQNLALEDDLADVEPVAQEMGERATGERDAADRSGRS